MPPKFTNRFLSSGRPSVCYDNARSRPDIMRNTFDEDQLVLEAKQVHEDDQSVSIRCQQKHTVRLRIKHR